MDLLVIPAALLLALGAIVFGLFLKGFDRLWVARMQSRVGPPITQGFYDVRKLLTKQSIVPAGAVRWLFVSMPALALTASLMVLLYLPIAGFDPLFEGYGDLILVVYLLAIPSVALVIGGFASGSPYGSIGAQREMVMMVAYELPLAIVIVALAWFHGSFDIGTMVADPAWEQVGVLGGGGLLLLMASLLYIIPAELAKVPFDSPEAETEIAGGLLVEYSGRNFALFYLTDGVKTVVVAAIMVALFVPWTVSDLLSMQGMEFSSEALGWLFNIAFFVVKVGAIVFFAVSLARSAFSRLRIEQAVQTYWFLVTGMALFGLLLLMVDGGAA